MTYKSRVHILKHSLFVTINEMSSSWVILPNLGSMASMLVLLSGDRLSHLRNLHTNLESMNVTQFTSLQSEFQFKTCYIVNILPWVGHHACLDCVLSPNPICGLLRRPSTTWLTKPNETPEQIESIQRYNKIMLY